MPAKGVSLTSDAISEQARKSRAELLAELEEKRLKNRRLGEELNELSIEEPDAPSGYDPYDHPGRSKEIRDSADMTDRRRKIMMRSRKLRTSNPRKT